MFYERKIKYLDYYEGGEKIRGGGFVKLELKEDKLRMELTVKGLYPTDSFMRDVMLRSGGTEAALGQISIQNGGGVFSYTGDLEKEMGDTGITYRALREIRIPIGGTRELVCLLAETTRSYVGQGGALREEAKRMPHQETAETVGEEEKVDVTENPERLEQDNARTEYQYEEQDNAGDEQHSGAQDKVQDRPHSEGQERVQIDAQFEEWNKFQTRLQQSEIQGKAQTELQSVDRKQDIDEFDTKPVETLRSGVHLAEPEQQAKNSVKEGRSRSAGKGKTMTKLLEDKWQQLSAIYPHIQPFQDERDYLSISPSDFVLFPSKCYKAVNNSFLLHGYYNYDHLILARMERRGQIMYYIGVPGNYFDREKQVAIMFGFESFECAAEPAKTGDFGYYMMRTEL